MAAYFPTRVRPFIAKVDLQDTIAADHINALQEEVRAIEVALNGTIDEENGMLTSKYTGAFAPTITWDSLDARLSNIEAGLVNGLTVSPYLKKAGDSMTVSNVVALSLKNSSQTTTSNLFESYDAANNLGFAISGAALPKVGNANVLYVGSSEYQALNTTANSALQTAEAIRFDPFLLAGM